MKNKATIREIMDCLGRDNERELRKWMKSLGITIDEYAENPGEEINIGNLGYLLSSHGEYQYEHLRIMRLMMEGY